MRWGRLGCGDEGKAVASCVEGRGSVCVLVEVTGCEDVFGAEDVFRRNAEVVCIADLWDASVFWLLI